MGNSTNDYEKLLELKKKLNEVVRKAKKGKNGVILRRPYKVTWMDKTWNFWELIETRKEYD